MLHKKPTYLSLILLYKTFHLLNSELFVALTGIRKLSGMLLPAGVTEDDYRLRARMAGNASMHPAGGYRPKQANIYII